MSADLNHPYHGTAARHHGVFAHENGRDYLAAFDDDLWCWPAEHDGWRRRTQATLAELDRAEELPPRLADLALRLSGADLL